MTDDTRDDNVLDKIKAAVDNAEGMRLMTEEETAELVSSAEAGASAAEQNWDKGVAWREEVAKLYGELPELELNHDASHMSEDDDGNPVGPLTSQQAWDKTKEVNQDPYGQAIVTFTELWARVMQKILASGEFKGVALQGTDAEFGEIAQETSHTVDCDPVNGGITGFMYGAAVSILSQLWIHGPQLRAWHNHVTQIHDEGDRATAEGKTLNPAILNIGGDS